ncbi:uncharacterized protein LOC113543737 isoform X3 [Pangasianodon hypophthalmus]|uniref:uncharacterized protein LOC113543737 isoform X3 n=1 Tax=Pangasianodon hypophthalmus TaxID=310915 RepID=UPI0023078A5C|nr:uncharacterized protein LOC113543737 isoform X3 [Pangasianodon hypophthalmus]
METGAISVSNTQNKAFKKRKPSPNFLKSQESNKESLISCSYSLIYHTLLMTTENEKKGNDKLCVYMDEMLHSIFFLGYIYDSPRLTPSDFFRSPETREQVMKKFPRPFEKYRSHLPTRTPFSILLNMLRVKGLAQGPSSGSLAVLGFELITFWLEDGDTLLH